MCDVLDVSPQGYYQWQERPKSDQQKANEALSEEIEEIFFNHREVYGSPRVHQVLRSRGRCVGENRVARLMRERGLSAAQPTTKKWTTDSDHQHPVAANVLDRQFEVDHCDTVWAGDITYVDTDSGWLYLAVLIDVCSRRVVGWSMKPHKTKNLAQSALEMALKGREPTEELLHHSDRGAQYASTDYRDILEDKGIEVSMSRSGDCYDNAVPESFFGSLKTESLSRQTFTDREEARQAIFDYIEIFYNRKRIHSSLDYMSPVDYEKELTV